MGDNMRNLWPVWLEPLCILSRQCVIRGLLPRFDNSLNCWVLSDTHGQTTLITYHDSYFDAVMSACRSMLA